MPQEEVIPSLRLLAMARNRFLYGLDVTPEERLTWSPGESAHTPLQLAGRLAGFLDFIGHMIRVGAMPERREAPPAPATREEAKQRLNTAFDGLRGVLMGLTEADLARKLPTPWGEPVETRYMIGNLPGITGYFQGQINYLQLAYGDTNANMPPNWGKEEI